MKTLPTIKKTWRGTELSYPAWLDGTEAEKTIRYACSAFSHLLENEEQISMDDFRWRIAKHASPSDRIISILTAFDSIAQSGKEANK